MIAPFVTFVTATIGRSSLDSARASVLAQTDPDWNHVVVGDGLLPTAHPDQRCIAIRGKRHYHESPTRNYGMRIAHSHGSQWVGFLDDDDTISPDYVRWLKEEATSRRPDESFPDVVIFRQTLPLELQHQDAVIPSRPEIVWGNVGISYACKLEWALRFPFKETKHEDLLQLVAMEAAGATIRFSNHIAYYGRDHRG